MKNKKLYTVISKRKGSKGQIIRHEYANKVVAESPKHAREKFVALTGYRGDFVVRYYANLL